MEARLATLLDVEQRMVFYDQPSPSDGETAGLLAGSVPILISAPHSTQHLRTQAWKQEEEYTAALGYLLHQETGAHLIYGRYMLDPDPHDDDDAGPYKRFLADLLRRNSIRMVIDLHGARGDRDFAVALGTMRGESFSPHEPRMTKIFQRQGFTFEPESSLDRLVVNPPRYTGGLHLPTITRFVWQKHHIPAVQIELSAWVRIVQRLPNATNARNQTAPHFRGDGARILRVIEALREFIVG